MEAVHGELLIGGMTSNEIDGEIDELNSGETCNSPEWHGRVSVAPDQLSQLETGWLYRLELDAGRSGQIVVSEMHVESPGNTLVLEFEGASSLQ